MYALSHGISLDALFPEETCPVCKKRFCFSKSEHVYRRKRSGKVYVFCSWSCLRKFDEMKQDPLEKRVIDCKKRLEYLESLKGVPREQWSDVRARDSKVPLSSLISQAENRLNTAIHKWYAKEGKRS